MKLRTVQAVLLFGLAVPFPMLLAVQAAAPELVWPAGGVGAALLLGALVLTVRLGRRLEQDLRALAAPARTLGIGELPTFPRLRIAEAQALGHEMENAATLLKTLLDEHDAVEERMFRSEERYRGVVDYSHEMIWIHTDGKVIFANNAAARGLGVAAPEDLVGRDVLSFYHPDDVPLIRQRMSQIYQSGGHLAPAESRLVRADGQVAFIEVRPMPFWYEGASSILVMAHDITERRHAEEALRRSEQRFRDFAEVASDRLWELGPDLRFTYVSDPAAARHLIGKTPVDLYGPDADPAEVRAHLETLQAREPLRDLRMVSVGSNEAPRHIRVCGKPVFDSGGTFLGYRGGTRDETAEAEARTQLEYMQRMELLGQLTGGMAHHFNNLLAVVNGNAELLLDRLAPDAGCEHGLAALIADAGQRGAALMRHLIAYARHQTLTPQPVDLNALVAGLAPLLHHTVGQAIVIDARLAADLWGTLADIGQFESALLHLATNAREAMPDGGRLTIETGNVTLASAGAVPSPGSYAMLAVSDTGTGMAPEVRDRACEPFFSTKPPGMRAGLGLSMVYGFVKQSGGHIKIESMPGAGTTVTIYLPRAAADEPAAEPLRAAS